MWHARARVASVQNAVKRAHFRMPVFDSWQFVEFASGFAFYALFCGQPIRVNPRNLAAFLYFGPSPNPSVIVAEKHGHLKIREFILPFFSRLQGLLSR